ncbi:hypothetical protein L8P88_10070, partial [Enterobacter roggenkampii]|nr:hypothetical protein [Enterobacter roggenkampii]
VCGKKIGPDPRNFNQRVSLGRNDLLIRTFPEYLLSKGWKPNKGSWHKGSYIMQLVVEKERVVNAQLSKM